MSHKRFILIEFTILFAILGILLYQAFQAQEPAQAPDEARQFLEQAKGLDDDPNLQKLLYDMALFRANDKDTILPSYITFYTARITSAIQTGDDDLALELYEQMIQAKDLAIQSGSLKNVIHHKQYDKQIQELFDTHINVIVERVLTQSQKQEDTLIQQLHKKYQYWALGQIELMEKTIKNNDTSIVNSDAEKERRLKTIMLVAQKFFKIESKYLDPMVCQLYNETSEKLWNRIPEERHVELAKSEIESDKLSPSEL